jgi:hypothetical protein
MTPMSRPVTTCEIRQNFKFYLIFFERAARETWKAKLPVSCCLYVRESPAQRRESESTSSIPYRLPFYPSSHVPSSLQPMPMVPRGKVGGVGSRGHATVSVSPFSLTSVSLSLPTLPCYRNFEVRQFSSSNLLLPCVRKLYYLHIFKRKQESLHTFN